MNKHMVTQVSVKTKKSLRKQNYLPQSAMFDMWEGVILST